MTTAGKDAMSKAVVLGGTGAVGQHVVGWLLTSGKWQTVVSVGRRPCEVPAEYNPEQFKAKLEQVVVNMDNMLTEAQPAFEGANTVFCCLGTTRKSAGSAEQFKKVDYEYVKLAAEAAKAANVHHFSLLTAQGSTAKVWANDWPIFHGLLYMKTKGLAEEAVKSQAFPYASIFRPGLIGRGDKVRPGEKLAKMLGARPIPASGLAKLMVQEAEVLLPGGQGTNATTPAAIPPVAVFEMGTLQKALKAGQPLPRA